MEERLRILFLDSWHRRAAVGSGSAAAVAGLAAGLEAGGHRVVRPAPPRLPLDLRRIVYNLTLPARARRVPFDLVVGFDVDGVWLPRRRAPDVVALKGVAADERRFETGVARLRLGALARLEARNARRARRVIVPSRYSRRVAIAAYGLERTRVRVVPEGIDLSFWAPGRAEGSRGAEGPERAGGPQAAQGAEGLETANEAPTILSVARQYPRKNTIALLRALPAILRRVPATRLRVVGGGPELPRLREEAAKLALEGHVRFLGPLPGREQVRAEYRHAHVFCLPSLQEGFGIVFLEAMASGLPVVALRAAAVPEVVRHGRTGFLTPPGDGEALADALATLLERPTVRARLGRAGRERALRFAWPSVAERFLHEALETDGPHGERRGRRSHRTGAVADHR